MGRCADAEVDKEAGGEGQQEGGGHQGGAGLLKEAGLLAGAGQQPGQSRVSGGRSSVTLTTATPPLTTHTMQMQRLDLGCGLSLINFLNISRI